MDSFIQRTTALAASKTSSYSLMHIQIAERNFHIWTNNRNKHEVDHFYKDALFGCIYVTKLYRFRVESFHKVLGELSSVDGVTSVLSDTSEVLSIGCGPGPEIAAYVDFARNDCGYRGQLNIVAVDAVNHWGDFIRASNDCDRATTIKFMNAFVDAVFVRRYRLSGVCIMSYPESINFNIEFWRTLAEMFDLVIVLDQGKRALHQNLQRANFSLRSLKLRGWKYYAFHLRGTKSSMRAPSVESCEDPCTVVTPARNSIASSNPYSCRPYLDNSSKVISLYRTSVQPPMNHEDPYRAVAPARNSIINNNSCTYKSYLDKPHTVIPRYLPSVQAPRDYEGRSRAVAPPLNSTSSSNSYSLGLDLDKSSTVIPSYRPSVQPPRAHEGRSRAVAPARHSTTSNNSCSFRSNLDKPPTVISSYRPSVQPPKADESPYRAVAPARYSIANGNSSIYRSYLDQSTTVTSSRRPSVQPPRKKGFFEMDCKPCTIL